MCDHYRGISILNAWYTVLGRIVSSRIQNIAESLFPYYYEIKMDLDEYSLTPAVFLQLNR
jgi:hypothetical protein